MRQSDLIPSNFETVMPQPLIKLHILILVVLASLALLARGDSQPAPTGHVPLSPPLICVWQRAGYGPPNRPDGLIFALWPDGQALWAANPDHGGKDLSHGIVALAEIDRFIARPEVRESLTQRSRSYVPPDASSVEISLRISGKDKASPGLLRFEWTESIRLTPAANETKLKEFVDFAQRWTALRIYCEDLRQKARDCTHNLQADDPILLALGYNLDEPYQTTWIREPKKTPDSPDK